MLNHYCGSLGFLAVDFNCIMNAMLDKPPPQVYETQDHQAPSILNIDSFCAFVQHTHTRLSSASTKVTVQSPANDLGKATFHRHLISYTSHQKKVLEDNRKNLEKDVGREQSPTVSNPKALVMARN